jgi:hypothetical protein
MEGWAKIEVLALPNRNRHNGLAGDPVTAGAYLGKIGALGGG